jgi:hypothetical protein
MLKNRTFRKLLKLESKYQNTASIIIVSLVFTFIGVAALSVTHAANDTTAVYYDNSPFTQDNYYTPSSTDRDNAVKVYGYNYVGIAFYACLASSAGSSPVYATYNSSTNEHLYTASSAERTAVINAGYIDQGIIFYDCAPNRSDAEPVYRLNNPSNNDHILTASTAEASSLVSAGWHNEGIAFYGSTGQVIITPPPPPPPPSPPHLVPSPPPSNLAPKVSTTPAPKILPLKNNTQPQQTPQPVVVIPPSIPTAFTATSTDKTPDVMLVWTISSGSQPIKGYLLDRSNDQQHWQSLNNGQPIASTGFIDQTTVPQKHYYYRLKAIDSANNLSGYALADVTTKVLTFNTFPDKQNTLISQDGNIIMVIPSGTVKASAQCRVQPNTSLFPPFIKGYAYGLGPYNLACINYDGSPVTNFAKPVTASVSVDVSVRKKFSNIAIYQLDVEWHQLIKANTKSNLSFNLTPADASFVLLGQPHKMPLLLKITLAFILSSGLVLAILVSFDYLTRLRIRRDLVEKNKDYFRKESGL